MQLLIITTLISMLISGQSYAMTTMTEDDWEIPALQNHMKDA